MAWCRQATSHYLSQCWPRSVSPYGITRAQCVKVIAGHGISSKQLFRSMMNQFTDAYMRHWISRWFFLAGWDRVPLDIVAAICHEDVIKWKKFPRYWPFVRGIHRSPVNSPHKGQWRGAFMFSLICAWTNRSVNNREAGDWRRYRAHDDVIVMFFQISILGARKT